MDSQAQPPAEPQPQAAERAYVPTAAHGRLKLTDWVIGTFPGRDAAQSCVDALVSAGFAEDDVLVESPGNALQQLGAEAEGERADSRLARLLHTLEEAISGAGSELRARYVAEANAGRWLAGAHDAQGNQIDRIRNVMVERGGRCINLFEPDGVRCMG
jgi:hypothetical protein